MAEETQNPDVEEETEVPQEGTAEEKTGQEDPTPPVLDADRLASDLKATRREAQNLRARLRQAEAAAAEAKAKVGELDSEKSDLLNQVRRSQAERAIIDVARNPQVGARRPEAVAELVDISQLEFDEKGNVKGVEDALAKVKERFPELFYSGGSADGGKTGDVPVKSDMNAVIRRLAGV